MFLVKIFYIFSFTLINKDKEFIYLYPLLSMIIKIKYHPLVGYLKKIGIWMLG